MRRICSQEFFITTTVIAILAWALIPHVGSGSCSRVKSCASNLMQLYKLGTVYAANHKGQWPEVSDGNYWVFFTKTTPALIAPEERSVLLCPVRDESDSDCDYRGPKIPWSRLQPGDPLAAERPGNHGPGESVHVLFKDGSVMEVDLDDPRWKHWNEVLGP